MWMYISVWDLIGFRNFELGLVINSIVGNFICLLFESM